MYHILQATNVSSKHARTNESDTNIFPFKLSKVYVIYVLTRLSFLVSSL